MEFWSVLLLAVGLAMDAAAASATRGLLIDRIRLRHVLAVAIAFGGFQAAMPALGWALGAQLGPALEAWDHWVAFALLAAIGGHMLWEARGHTDGERAAGPNPFGAKVMLVLAVATSIDALAAGISLPILRAPLLSSVVIIGAVTVLLSIAGLFAGRRFGALLGRRLDLLGGVVLIALGTKVLVQHLSA
jgi:putative Mn2+ efflux pump MntP